MCVCMLRAPRGSEGTEGRASITVAVGCGTWAPEQAFGHFRGSLSAGTHGRKRDLVVVWKSGRCFVSTGGASGRLSFSRAEPLAASPSGCLSTALGPLPAARKPCLGGLRCGRPGEAQKLTRKQESRTITTHEKKNMRRKHEEREETAFTPLRKESPVKGGDSPTPRDKHTAHLGASIVFF